MCKTKDYTKQDAEYHRSVLQLKNNRNGYQLRLLHCLCGLYWLGSEDTIMGESFLSSPQPLNRLKDHVNFSVTIQKDNFSFSVTVWKKAS